MTAVPTYSEELGTTRSVRVGYVAFHSPNWLLLQHEGRRVIRRCKPRHNNQQSNQIFRVENEMVRLHKLIQASNKKASTAFLLDNLSKGRKCTLFSAPGRQGFPSPANVLRSLFLNSAIENLVVCLHLGFHFGLDGTQSLRE